MDRAFQSLEALGDLAQEDLVALARLAGELGYSVGSDVLLGRLDRALGGERGAVILARNRGAVVGWIHILTLASLTDEPCALIAGLVVAEAERGCGLGRGLVAAAEEWARTRGLARMLVRSREARTDAHRFYGELGYELRKTQRVFSKALDSAEG